MPMFHCPSCGTDTSVGEEFAGKRIVCPKCEQAGAVPGSADATPQGITTPELAHGPLRRAGDLPEALPSIREPDIRGWFAWFTMGNAVTVLTIGLIATCAAALLMPATRRVRESAARTQSTSNLMNIGLALHGFHDANRRLPFNGSNVAVDGMPYAKNAKASDAYSGSWAFQILPYIDQTPLFQNPGVHVGVAAYMCPGRGRSIKEDSGGAWCDFYLIRMSTILIRPRNPTPRIAGAR